MKKKLRINKEIPKENKKEKQTSQEKSNSFEILQEEGEQEDQTMENQDDKESDNSASSEGTHTKRKALSEAVDKGKEQEELAE